jgi:hypothetical protein
VQKVSVAVVNREASIPSERQVARMTNSDLVCIAIGLTLNVLTFFLGTAVGVSLVKRRKDSDNDRDNRKRYEAEGFRYFPQDSKG